MKEINNILFFMLLIGGISSCSKNPEPIKYGDDNCHFCEMTIVDRAFSAQAVSEKGKQFKYDAIECMVNDSHQHSTAMAVQQVADFSNPGSMIPIEEAIFIVNDSISSPMGANLAAVKKESSITSDRSADIFFWNELFHHLQGGDSIFAIE